MEEQTTWLAMFPTELCAAACFGLLSLGAMLLAVWTTIRTRK